MHANRDDCLHSRHLYVVMDVSSQIAVLLLLTFLGRLHIFASCDLGAAAFLRSVSSPALWITGTEQHACPDVFYIIIGQMIAEITVPLTLFV